MQANDIKVDLNDLAAADVSEANDFIAIIDADDSNATKKESIADFVAAIAGTGLSAGSGKLSVSAASGVNALGSGGDNGDGDHTLTESFNFATGTITDNRTYTLPASAGLQAGDTVHVKLSAVDEGKAVTIARAGSQTIDGVTSIVLESPGTAVSLKYVGNDAWMIF